MTNIDRNILKQYDSSNMFDVITSFPKQIEEAINIGYNIKSSVRDSVRDINKIIITGMGGSAIGGDLIRSFLNYRSGIPIFVNRNYHLPDFADENALVIVSSYSGSTEETLSAFDDAKKKRCSMIALSSNGDLESKANDDDVYFIKIPGGYQPRCALAYSFFPLMILLSKLNLINDYSDELTGVMNYMKRYSELYSALEESNPAIQYAQQIYGTLPFIYGSNDVLDSVVMRWKTQFSENSKMLAHCNYFSELNHNEIVGWETMPEILSKITVLFLTVEEDNPRIVDRISISKKIIEEAGAAGTIEISGIGNTLLKSMFHLIYLGDWVTYYLAILNGVDPTPVKKIDVLKGELSKIK